MTDQPTQLSGHLLRDYDETIATLRQAWLTRGPKQDALARRMGCSRPQVSAWLRGEIGAVAVRRLLALAGALGFDLALVPRDGDGPCAPRHSPQSDETGFGVPLGTLGGSGGSVGRAEIVHLIRDGQSVTDCCGRTPFELPGTDRIAVGLGAEATCTARASGAEPIADGGIGASIVILDAREDA